MKIYLMHHGHAATLEEARVASDELRPLTARGRGEVKLAIRNLLGRGGRPSLILASPLVRAQQTAKAAKEIIPLSPPMRTYAPLANLINGEDLIRKLLEEDLGAPEVLLVGHQPQLGDAAAVLTGSSLPLHTAGVVAVETSGPGAAALLWAANPEDISG